MTAKEGKAACKRIMRVPEVETIVPIKGAATYEACAVYVWMTDTEGRESIIQTCRTYELAQKAAVRWQKKENKAVTKANKSNQGAI